MSKKYIHFSLDTDKPEEKKVIDFLDSRFSHMSLKVLFLELIKRVMEKSE